MIQGIELASSQDSLETRNSLYRLLKLYHPLKRQRYDCIPDVSVNIWRKKCRSSPQWCGYHLINYTYRGGRKTFPKCILLWSYFVISGKQLLNI